MVGDKMVIFIAFMVPYPRGGRGGVNKWGAHGLLMVCPNIVFSYTNVINWRPWLTYASDRLYLSGSLSKQKRNCIQKRDILQQLCIRDRNWKKKMHLPFWYETVLYDIISSCLRQKVRIVILSVITYVLAQYRMD